jgi:hypothetical protein
MTCRLSPVGLAFVKKKFLLIFPNCKFVLILIYTFQMLTLRTTPVAPVAQHWETCQLEQNQ